MAFIEKSTAGTFVDVDKSGGAPSVGDVFVFQSDLFDPATNAKVGTVEGHCTVITASLSDCDASGILVDGQIRVGGATTNANVNVLAVTGGTGVYRNVSGQNTTETIDAQHEQGHPRAHRSAALSLDSRLRVGWGVRWVDQNDLLSRQDGL